MSGQTAPHAAPVVPRGGTRQGLPLTAVHLSPDGFWGQRQEINSANTLTHCLTWMERLGWLRNFDQVADGVPAVAHAGWQFADSEAYKLLEAMAWELGRRHDDELAATYDALVARIAAAQDPDGYLNTAFGHGGQPERYSDMSMGHELYCAGHLLQAATARLRTGHDDELVAVGRRVADHVQREFADDVRATIDGHPEIEVALVEFARATGDRRYLDRARDFVDRRGHGILPAPTLQSSAYFQDDVPVRDAESFHGHAVRALYLASGAVDVAWESDDQDLLSAIEGQWQRTVGRRTYVTGGMGSRHQDEGFGDDFELPADRAYCETCAGVASIMLSWRLYLATGRVEYADLIERTLFNVVATSPSADGRSFFYANPLHQRVPATSTEGDEVNMRAEGAVRAPWFDVSCCPTNVARMLASVGAYVAAHDGHDLVVHQYVPGRIEGERVTLDVDTDYPVSGRVELRVVDASEGPVGIRLRIPSWASGARVQWPGEEPIVAEPGWCAREVSVQAGDRIVLDLPVGPRLSWPDDRIDAVRGTVCVERGPVVLCLESADLPAEWTTESIRFVPGTAPVSTADGALVTLTQASTPAPEPGALPVRAQPATPAEAAPTGVPLIPYHRWAERGPATMRVFLPVAQV